MLKSELDTVAALTTQVAAGQLSCVVQHDAGTSYDDALNRVAPALRAASFSHIGRPVTIDAGDTKHEVWHTDLPPELEGPPIVTVNVHFTHDGEGVACIVPSKLAYARHVAHFGAGGFDLIRRELEEGRVDPDFFSTTCYKTVFRAGTLILFATTGQQPPVYLFSTLTFPRRSTVGVARYESLDLFKHFFSSDPATLL